MAAAAKLDAPTITVVEVGSPEWNAIGAAVREAAENGSLITLADAERSLADLTPAQRADVTVARMLHAYGITTCATMWGSRVGGRAPGKAMFWSFRTFKGGKSDVHTVAYRVLSERDVAEIVGRYRHGTVRA